MLLVNVMNITKEDFASYSIKEFYESMLWAATKMDEYMVMMDDLLRDHTANTKYNEAKATYQEFSDLYFLECEALTDKFGKTMRRQIVSMIDSDLQLAAQRRKLFAN